MAAGSVPGRELRADSDTGVDVWRLRVRLGESSKPSLIPVSTSNDKECSCDPRDTQSDTGVDVWWLSLPESSEPSLIPASTSDDKECAREPRNVTDTGVDIPRTPPVVGCPSHRPGLVSDTAPALPVPATTLCR